MMYVVIDKQHQICNLKKWTSGGGDVNKKEKIIIINLLKKMHVNPLYHPANKQSNKQSNKQKINNQIITIQQSIN